MSSFEYSPYVEMSLQKLEESGVKREQIVVVPLDKRVEEKRLLDSIHQSDGKSSLAITFSVGFIFMLFGTIYGFVLSWGPIFWGLIGLIVGIILGLIIEISHFKHKQKLRRAYIDKTTEVILIVECEERNKDIIEKILWEHYALGVGRVKK